MNSLWGFSGRVSYRLSLAYARVYHYIVLCFHPSLLHRGSQSVDILWFKGEGKRKHLPSPAFTFLARCFFPPSFVPFMCFHRKSLSMSGLEKRWRQWRQKARIKESDARVRNRATRVGEGTPFVSRVVSSTSEVVSFTSEIISFTSEVGVFISYVLVDSAPEMMGRGPILSRNSIYTCQKMAEKRDFSLFVPHHVVFSTQNICRQTKKY